MTGWISRFLSMDDLWSVLGFALLMGASRLQSPALPPQNVSLLASGMLAIYWLASERLRARNLERHPNARVALWALVAVVSALLIGR
jgi:hypothetical protein